MSVASFFEKIVGLQQQKAQATATGYRGLVASIATGKEPAPEEVERVLASAGKSVDDLRQDVDRQQTRLALKALVNSPPKFEAERRELDSRMADADRELAAAEQRHEEITAPLYATRRELDLAIADAERASTTLVQSCEDADLLQEMNELNAEARQVTARSQELVSRIAFMEEKARVDRERADRDASPGDADARRDVAERYQQEAEAARRDQKRLEKSLAELGQRRKQIERRMRDW